MHTTKVWAVFGCAVAAACACGSTYSFHVSEAGHGKPLILIPGLTCPGMVWNATVDHLKSRYHCYVLTLPGFAGQPPIEGPFLSSVRDQIIDYVKERKMDHPAVIGHSLGGFMVFSLGSTSPDLFGPLIAVDGLPFISTIFAPQATAESSRPFAEQIAKLIASATPKGLRESMDSNLGQEISDPKYVKWLAPECAKSDPRTMAKAFKEMMVTDLREAVANIKSPVLLLGAGKLYTTPDKKAQMEKTYASEISKIPHAKLVIDWNSKHFIQLDDPKFFYHQIDAFLAKG